MQRTGSQHQRQHPSASHDHEDRRRSIPTHPIVLGIAALIGQAVGLPEPLSLVVGVFATIGYAAFMVRYVVHQLALAADEAIAWADRRQSRRQRTASAPDSQRTAGRR
jgi:hypothetical protein